MSNCPRCRREEWTGSLPINRDQCESTGAIACVLTENQNKIVAAMRSMAKSPGDKLVLRTAMVIVEEITPSSTSCPLCGAKLVVNRGTIKAHYPANEASKLCFASDGALLGGIFFPKEK